MEHLAVLLFLIPAAIVGYQALIWLQSGSWPPLPLSGLFAYFGVPTPKTSWVGAQRILDYLMAMPVSFAALCGVFAVIFLMVKIEKELVERQRR